MSTITRRQMLDSTVVTALALSGCVTQTTEEETENEQSTTVRTETAPATEEETTRETTTSPTLNETPYPLAQQRLDWEYWDGNEATVYLFTEDNWRSVFSEDALSERSQSFLTETDFGSHSVVALVATVADPANRWILESVDGLRTESLTLQFREYDGESGANSSPPYLVLVRLPNRGTRPKRVTADLGDEKISTVNKTTTS